MKQALFRKTALGRLSSPDELDQLITITQPRSWITLMGLLLIIGVGVYWGFTGEIPVDVSGVGIIIASDGVTSVVSGSSGQVSDVSARAGNYVNKGDVLARIDQSELVEKVNQLKSDIELAQNFDIETFNLRESTLSPALSDMYEIAVEMGKAQATVGVMKELLDYQEDAFQLLEKDADEARKKADEALVLYESDAIPKSDFDDAMAAYESASLSVKVAQAALNSARAAASAPQEKLDYDTLKDQLEVQRTVILADLAKQLQVALDDLKDKTEIASLVGGRILEVNIEAGDVIEAGTTVATVISENQTVNNREVVVYVSPEEGKKIHEGMTAHVSPTIIKKEEYGYILGTVIAVSEYPVSTQSIVKTIGNQSLASQFSEGSSPIEVRINLTSDPTTASGFKWSTTGGPPMTIDSGNICTASVVIEYKKPVSLVIPYLKKKLNLY